MAKLIKVTTTDGEVWIDPLDVKRVRLEEQYYKGAFAPILSLDMHDKEVIQVRDANDYEKLVEEVNSARA
mgnify:CR=1 FL=1